MFRKGFFAGAVAAVVASTACSGGTPTNVPQSGTAPRNVAGWGYESGGKSEDTTWTTTAADTIVQREGGGAIGSGN